MKNKICTSIAQSKKLIELGIDVHTADMWYQPIGYSIIDGEEKPTYFPMVIRDNISDYDIPAWSLIALLELLPTIKVSKNEEANPFIAKTPEGEYCVTYCTLYKEIESSKICDNPIDACIDIIAYLSLQGLL